MFQLAGATISNLNCDIGKRCLIAVAVALPPE